MANTSKKRQQLLETARDLFFQHGIKRVTVEEICRMAHVSKMTFYKYFTNKEDIAEHVLRLLMEQGWRKLNEVEALPIPFPQKLRLMQEYKLAITAQLSPDFLEELAQMPFYVQERKKWTRRVMQFITDAQQRGDIRPEIRPEFILAMADKLNDLLADKQLISLYSDYVEFTREIWNFFYYGIVTRSEPEQA
ncbi:TetR family transcriptional regulator [candidate division KSB3 bacterium]|jgi:AcrR family transcriptional regulator|uniref:TetR family transcriptional regulator n=1 Tax=candidate division KSB3 bacterium TaxID=2044937 RepID=A0A9D5JRV8_9BACT|nr:TetR family transcriptional regulator [candidate division KSB3 bacterium]MBD3323033.1 TetR family transcriptional regulator [candidate division KSB3 bacterium]